MYEIIVHGGSTQDKATGDVYYVNTWNQEIRWVKPLEMSLFEDRPKGDSRPGTPNTSAGSGFDADTFDDGVDSIGSRFTKLHGQLTDKATQAAEEEAGMLRYVEATQGGDMLAAASEWTFVSTDSRLSRARCWFRARTSEYFWGKIPPLDSVAQAPTVTRGKDSDGNAGYSAIVGGKVGGIDPGGQAVSFTDRAAGETWLKTQDIPSLLERSETVCSIGPAGWRQLRATLLPDNALASQSTNVSAEDHNSTTVLTTASNSATGKSLDALGGADSAGQDCNPHHQPNGIAPTDVANVRNVVNVANVANVASVASVRVASASPASRRVPSFMFFHHAEIGQVRWCLSPRSALATPGTPRGEFSLSGLAAHNNRRDEEDGDGEENLRSSEAASGAAGTSWDNHSEDNEWEVVEDGDMIFYYNRVSGASTWDPPPGWEHNGRGADDGAL